MPAPQSVAGTDSSGSDSPAAATASASGDNSTTSLLEGLLESSVSRPPLGEWLASPSRDIHTRLVQLSFASPSPASDSSSSTPSASIVGDSSRSESSGPPASPSYSHSQAHPNSCSYPYSQSHACSHSFSRSRRSYSQSHKSVVTSYPSAPSTGASMAPTCIHQSSTASQHPPSLYNFSEATPTETSISTNLAYHLSGVPLLEDVDGNGLLEHRPPAPSRPVFECAFWFLSCSYISHDPEEWMMHCLSHFRGEEPPRRVTCPLCSDFVVAGAEDGWSAWNARMRHVAGHHLRGTSLRASRPDFHLFQHLWQKRLIDDQDLKELKGGNHNLTRPPENFTVTNGRRARVSGRGGRRQHVGRN